MQNDKLKSNNTIELVDLEAYTTLSFAKLIKNSKFPKGLLRFFLSMITSFFRQLGSIKAILKRIGACLLMSLLAFIWNVFALCYINDTFNIDYTRRIFGDAAPYLIAGTVQKRLVMGLPIINPRVIRINTSVLTFFLYFLIAIFIRTLIEDIFRGRILNNIKSIFGISKLLKYYNSVSTKKFSYYIYFELIIGCVLNIIIFNPFAVLLLALMLFFSFTKSENGAISPLLMIFVSSASYDNVVNRKKSQPLYATQQFKILGLSISLLICSIFNFLIWCLLKFNFWVRVVVSLLLIVFALLKLGILKISKTTSVMIIITSYVILQIVVLNSFCFMAFADDGGWSESGRNLLGLIKNSGWPTIALLSSKLSLAVALGYLTYDMAISLVNTFTKGFNKINLNTKENNNKNIGNYNIRTDYNSSKFNNDRIGSSDYSNQQFTKEVLISDKELKTYEKGFVPKEELNEEKSKFFVVEDAESELGINVLKYKGEYKNGSTDSKLETGIVVGPEIGKAASIYQVVKAENEFGSGQIDIGRGELSGKAQLKITNEGFNGELSGSAEVSAFKAQGKYNFIKNDYATLGVKGNVKILEAHGEAKARLGIGEDGINALLKGEIGANVASVEGKVSGSLCGIKGSIGGELKFGIGVEGKIGIENGEFVYKVGAALGPGASVSGSIGLKPEEFINTVNYFADKVGGSLNNVITWVGK